MKELMEMGKERGLKFLSSHEQNGTLSTFISENAPEFIVNGEVMKFTLLDVLGWW